jgi:hypothetical protein
MQKVPSTGSIVEDRAWRLSDLLICHPSAHMCAWPCMARVECLAGPSYSEATVRAPLGSEVVVLSLVLPACRSCNNHYMCMTKRAHRHCVHVVSKLIIARNAWVMDPTIPMIRTQQFSVSARMLSVGMHLRWPAIFL